MGWISNLLGPLTAATVYTAIGLSFASVGGFAAHFFTADPHLWSLYGFCLAIGPVYLYFSRPSIQEKHLVFLREWKNRNLITQSVYDDMVRRAMRYYGDRNFGRLPELGSVQGEQSQPVEGALAEPKASE